jgi:antitoxin component of MazEF toxin-antitoxin module
MYVSKGRVMPLTRKTRLSGSSIVVTIPSQLVDAYGINSGDVIEIIPLKDGEIKIRKVSGGISSRGTA